MDAIKYSDVAVLTSRVVSIKNDVYYCIKQLYATMTTDHSMRWTKEELAKM